MSVLQCYTQNSMKQIIIIFFLYVMTRILFKLKDGTLLFILSFNPTLLMIIK